MHPEADPDVIRAAYKVLARKLHPDGRVGTPLDSAAEGKMTDLNWAYALLRNASTRVSWDLDRRFRAPPPPVPEGAHGAPRPDLGEQGGAAPLDFGRYSGWTLREVAKRDIEYLRWLGRHPSGARHRRTITAILHEHDKPKGAANKG